MLDDESDFSCDGDYYLDNGEKMEITKPVVEKLPKFIREAAQIVIRDKYEELDEMADERPEEFMN
jgi:hypothetical protein